jgi:hypothetical protein
VALLPGEVDKLFEAEPVSLASYPLPIRELVRGLLSGVDSKGRSVAISVAAARADGDFAYDAGVDGVADVPADARVLSISGRAGADGGTVKIGDGPEIPIPPNDAWSVEVGGRLAGDRPVEFVGTVAYFVEYAGG